MTDDERDATLRAMSAPLDLTEDDFDQLRLISPKAEADAREARRQAQLAIVRARTSAPVQTKAWPAAPIITPIGDGEPFSRALLDEASELGNRDPARLTDLHLRHVATYDPGLAREWATKRDRALQQKAQAAASPPARPRRPGPRVLTKKDIPDMVDGIVTVLKKMDAKLRADFAKAFDINAADLNRALAALETRITTHVQGADDARTKLLQVLAERKQADDVLRERVALLEQRLASLRDGDDDDRHTHASTWRRQ